MQSTDASLREAADRKETFQRQSSAASVLFTPSALSFPSPSNPLSHSALSSVHRWFESTSARSLVPSNRALIGIHDSWTLSKAVSVLAKNKILSAPVFKDDETCVGILDALTIISYLSKHHSHTVNNDSSMSSASKVPLGTPAQTLRSIANRLGAVEQDTQQEAVDAHMEQAHTQVSQTDELHSGHMGVRRDSLEKRSDEAPKTPEEIGNTLVRDVIAGSERSFLVPFFADNPLSTLIELFASGSHRVMLISSAFESQTICSQSDLMVALSKQISQGAFAELEGVTIDSLHLPRRRIVSLPSTVTVAHALHTLSTENVTSVALLDDRGRLSAAFESSDLRGMSDFRELHLNVLEFLQRRRPASLKPLVARHSDTLSSVIHALAATRAHRAWYLAGDDKPIDVISRTDVARLLCVSSPPRTILSRELNGDTPVAKLWRSADSHVRAIDTEPDQFRFACF